MKAMLSLFAACLLSIAAARAGEVRNDKQDLLRVEAEVCRAFEAGDAAALRRSLDDGFTLVDSHGTVSGLAQNLAEVDKREPYYDEFRNHDQEVRLYGDAALIVGITSIRGRAGGEAFQADFRYTDTWIRRDGRWLLAASHASRLPTPK